MTSMFVPDPVISLAIRPNDRTSQINMSKALNRFSKEDPTFRAYHDGETGDNIIEGMGELHLEIYLERMRREYRADVTADKPQVAYRETISKQCPFNYTHKKQTGGAGQFGRIAGYIEPVSDHSFVFENRIVGGRIPSQYIPSCEKGFRECLSKGLMLGFPVTGIRVVINDGASHSVDSSEMAFQTAARGAFREAYASAGPYILEPVMRAAVEVPNEYQGATMALLNQRRGIIVGSQDDGRAAAIEAHVPLAEMFGFATVLRSATQGKGQFTMELMAYKQLPASLADDLVKQKANQRNPI